MPQSNFGSREFVESNECDAVHNCDIFELGDSPPSRSNPHLSNFLEFRFPNKETFSDSGRKVVSDNNHFPHSQFPVLADDKENCNLKKDANHNLELCDLPIPTGSNFGGKKTPVSYDAENSLNLNGYGSKTDKIKAKSDADLQEKSLADLFSSISSGGNEAVVCSAFSGTYKYSDNIIIKQKTDNACNSSVNLSDLLTSISLLDESKHKPSSFKNALLDPNKYADAGSVPNLTDLYKELNNSNSTLHTKKKPKNGFISSQVEIKENLSDILSKFAVNDLSPSVKQKESKVSSKQSHYQDSSNADTSATENNIIIQANDISKGNFYSEKYITKTGDLENHLPLLPSKSNQFSLFDTPSNNVVVFSTVKLDSAENILPSDCNEDSECSMLDLFKSVNHVAVNETLNLKDKTIPTLEKSVDLTTCLKVNENTHDPFLLSITPNDAGVKNTYESIQIWPEENVMPYTRTDLTSTPVPCHVDLKQSLFAKCLQCKPKRDYIALKKVVDIKRNLLENLFYPETTSELTSKSIDVKFSDDPIFDITGRHMFGT